MEPKCWMISQNSKIFTDLPPRFCTPGKYFTLLYNNDGSGMYLESAKKWGFKGKFSKAILNFLHKFLPHLMIFQSFTMPLCAACSSLNSNYRNMVKNEEKPCSTCIIPISLHGNFKIRNPRFGYYPICH